MNPPFASDAVAQAFADLPDNARSGLLKLRSLIFEQAAADQRVGALAESLRWGQPAYLTSETKSGTTVRLGVPKTARFGLFVHCQTSLIRDHQDMFPNADRCEGNRAILFERRDEIDADRHGWLIARALTYHL